MCSFCSRAAIFDLGQRMVPWMFLALIWSNDCVLHQVSDYAGDTAATRHTISFLATPWSFHERRDCGPLTRLLGEIISTLR